MSILGDQIVTPEPLRHFEHHRFPDDFYPAAIGDRKNSLDNLFSLNLVKGIFRNSISIVHNLLMITKSSSRLFADLQPIRCLTIPSTKLGLRPFLAALILLSRFVMQPIFGADSNEALGDILAEPREELSNGEYIKAEKLAEKVVKKFPNRGEVYLLLAQIQRMQSYLFYNEETQKKLFPLSPRRHKEATEYQVKASQSLERAIKLLNGDTLGSKKNDKDFASHLAKAWNEADQKKYIEALKEFDAAEKHKPAEELPVYEVMLTSKMITNYARWGAAIERLVESHDSNLKKWAKIDYQKFKERLSKYVEEQIKLLANLLKENRFDDAEQLLNSSLRRAPQAGVLHFELAKLLLQRGQIKEAVSEFQESIRNGYSDADQFIAVAKARKMLDHSGYLSLVSDNFGESAAKIVREHWEKIRLQVHQEDRQNFEKLAMEARDFARNQKLNEAIQLAKKGAAEFPNLEDSRLLLEEIQTYERRAECNSLVNTAQEHLKQNHFIEAQANLSRALDLIPNYPDALKLQQELPTLKLSRKNFLLDSTRLIYRKQTQKAYENLKEVETLFPGDDQVNTLRQEVNGFLTKVAELRKRAATAAVGRPDLGVLEAITELRGLMPEDNEVIANWQRFCVLTNSLGMRLIFIPSTQKLGSLAIVKRGFFLAELETTEAQWANIMPHSLSNLLYRDFSEKKWRQDGTYYHEAQDHPVCQVSLVDALAFVDKLNQREKRLYRLPNPEEWEYACLAGRTITRLTADSLDSVAWFHGNAAKKGETYPHRIGQKSPNDWGFYDMLGNIAEWCASENINTLNKNQLGVVKGGSWDDLAEKITPDHQLPVNIFQKARTIGFRVALDLP